MRFYVVCSVVAAASAALVAYACLTPASALMMEEAKDLRRAILKRVPIGSLPEAARAVLEPQGFACAQVDNQPFSVSDPDSGAPIEHAATDVLRCDSGKRGFIITKRWLVFLVDRGGSVTSVAVSADVGGP